MDKVLRTSPLRSTLCATNMKAFFKFSTIALLLVVLIGLVLLFAIGNSVYSGKIASLKFVNNSGQLIESANILVAGKSCSVKKLGAGGEIVCHFENLHDSSYSVSVTLQGGAVYSEPSLGYVTGGLNLNDTIVINRSGVIELVSIPST
jgi:hypothetical protein